MEGSDFIYHRTYEMNLRTVRAAFKFMNHYRTTPQEHPYLKSFPFHLVKTLVITVSAPDIKNHFVEDPGGRYPLVKFRENCLEILQCLASKPKIHELKIKFVNTAARSWHWILEQVTLQAGARMSEFDYFCYPSRILEM